MARQRMISRTIKVTEVTVLCMDVVTCEPCNRSLRFQGYFKDDNKLMKAIKEDVETENFKVVHIVDKVEHEVLVGMSETDFLNMAFPLDDKRKPIQVNE